MPTLALEAVVQEINPPITAAVIWLHGLGADGHDFANLLPQLQLPSSLGIRFIIPHAPIRPVTINAGYQTRAWYDIYRLDTLEQEDKAGIESSRQSIEQLIKEQQNEGILSTHIILAGFSQGGAVALYTGLRYSEPLGGILGLSTYLPLADFIPASSHKVPILLTHGTFDDVLPYALGKQARNLLIEKGYPVEWREYPMGHEVCMAQILDIRAWLLARLMGWGSSLDPQNY